jgi:hypothetical protein
MNQSPDLRSNSAGIAAQNIGIAATIVTAPSTPILAACFDES